MADQQKPRGRGAGARGRARPAGSSGQGPHGSGQGPQGSGQGPQGSGQGPRQPGGLARGPPPGLARGPAPPQPTSAWGPPKPQPAQFSQQHQIRAPVPQPASMQAGRASFRGGATSDAPGSSHEAQFETAVAGGGDNGNGSRRGTVRGRRQIAHIARTRPDHITTKQGTTGQPIKLSANYFKLMKQPDWHLYQYRVDFAPEEDRTNVKRALFRRAVAQLIPAYMFDGTILYCANRLEPTELFVEDSVTQVKVRVTIKLVGDVQMGDYTYIQVFNILMRKCLGFLKLQLVGRNFFDAAAKVLIPEHHLELWPGYTTSIRQHERDILMCAEIATKVMRQESVMNFLMESMQKDRANYRQVFQQGIIGCVVLTDYNNRTYRIDDVDWQSNPKTTFDKKDGSKISYAEYYQQRYNLNIRDHQQPMLISRAKDREIRAGMAETIYLVPELCRMTGLTDQQRNNFQLMKAVAEYTRVNPGVRIQKLMEFSNRLKQNKEVMAEVRNWDFQLSDKLVEFTGRVLPPQSFLMGGKQEFKVGKDCDWTRDLRSNAMINNGVLDKWVIMFVNRNRQAAQSFCQLLSKAANGMKWRIPQPVPIEIRDDRLQEYLKQIEVVIGTHNPNLIMCVLSNNKADRYSAIKKKCCVERAVPTQVMLQRNLDSKGAMSIATKVAIQMNCKLGGAPWALPLPYEHLMVVGYDVCHDTQVKANSFGAMVASLDRNCTRYFSTATPHTNGEELSNDFALNIVKACRTYQSYRGCFPERIMIYRDGVGDGQLPYVFEHEVSCIREMLTQSIYPDGNLKMAFIVVTKRISTRVFVNGENPPPGTVVDDIITMPERYDFYIVSQCVRQGTVAPTSYNILFDTTGMNADQMHRLTYRLTHQYYNWSGTVRVPAPCQYAHKLAFLVAQSLHRTPHGDLNTILYYL